jgi:aerobic-type carbon monoxide dehydrogenase small subunit (CoxS/CutS family)
MHPIQQAFVETGAVQCGYCTPAMVLAAHELLEANPDPTEHDVRDALSGQLCRCTGYVKPVEAVMLAARRMKEGGRREEGLSGSREADRPRGRSEAGVR